VRGEERATGQVVAHGLAVASRWALWAVVALGALLRLWGLGRQSFWYDEWLTTEATGSSLADLPRHVANREGIPPTYFLVMWVWARLFGEGELALRTVSALAGILTIPLAYAVGREVLPRRGHTVGLVAALLVAVHPMLVWYSQEARPYALLACFGAASLLGCVRVWRRGRRVDLVLWAVAGAATVAVHYFGGFVVAGEALALLVLGRVARRNDRPATSPPAISVRDLLVALVPSGVVLVALIPVAVRQHSHELNRLWIADFTVSYRLGDAAHSFMVGPSPPAEGLWIVVAVVMAVAALLLATRAPGDDRAAAGVAAGIGTAAVALALVVTAVGSDVVLGRYLITALVPLVVGVAIGLSLPRTRVVGLAGLSLLTIVSLVAVGAVARDPDLQRTEWRQVADAAGSGDGPGDRVLVLNVHGDMGGPLLHYLDGARRLDGDERVRVRGVDILVSKPSSAPCNLLVGRSCGLIFLGAPPAEPLVARGLALEEQVELDQFRLDRYRFDRPVGVTTADLVSPTDRPGALVLVLPG
jgi:uncharacterized membrane protein